MRVQRRLAAVLAADVAGYSHLMGRDEERTLADLKDARQVVIDPTVAAYGGRIVKTTGDGLLVEFASVVDAVRCALEVQSGMLKHNNDVPQHMRIEFRIGVHVGDIIIDDNDIFGDGVNIAARLEGVAKPGGVCISDDAQRQVRGKLEVVFDDIGEQTLKNIVEPMRAWRVRGVPDRGIAAPKDRVQTDPILTLPDKPSIAVLPFQNMSRDAEQEYFADGIVEDIITALSRFKSLFVIARNSSFTYKGKPVDIKKVGLELGVRYVLEGSVRKVGGRVRITGQLIEAATGAHLWAEKFDGALDDIFELQDQVTKKLVGAIAPKLQQAEIERSVRKPTQSLDACNYYYRGISRLQLMTPDSNAEALQHFKQAIDLDPSFAAAYGLASECYRLRHSIGWARNDAEQLALGRQFALLAVEFGQDDAVALACAAQFFGFAARDAQTADTLVDQALSVNPNLFRAWQARCWTSIYLGEHERALAEVSHTMRLNPIDPEIHQAETAMGIALLFLHRPVEALEWISKALTRRASFPSALRFATVAYSVLNRTDEAYSMVKRLQNVDPDLRISQLKSWVPFQRSEDAEMFIEGMRKAGMLE
ncbi:adenylate/guanylate cyclase domain-containing protein [Bradyrhizobium sp. CB1650]|uniref:adenylate/guanylate cyclase domain-containing protein n=1 Tax=Bradyrhizobium sp. CB1650 TaxID=3039153 RepID=UPI00243545AE|nr:adenylate/guanylate cyclase domain-containing protein [Bradyrhizobium sp. CB1650]WGD56896.1 adenylate/guanylate cyclase domain-containing protein [Bradyrhizobium sp. CB1650]